MREFFRRLYYLLNRRRLERELENDMEAHREMLSADNRKDFGNPALLSERAGEAWGWSWLDRLFQDLRFGVRLLRKSPALAFTAIAVLALIPASATEVLLDCSSSRSNIRAYFVDQRQGLGQIRNRYRSG